MPRYFILLNSIVNGIFLISFSDCSLLVYKNLLDVYILILYSVNSFISSSSCFYKLLRFPIYRIMSSVNKGSFNSAFSIWIPFISLSYLVTPLARIYSAVLQVGRLFHVVFHAVGHVHRSRRYCKVKISP